MATRTEFQDEVVRLPDLATGEGVPSVVGLTFRRCVVRGPAVAYFEQDNEVDNCRFEVSDPEALFWEVPEEAERVGVIVVSSSRFDECTFTGIGLAGTADDLEPWRAAFTSGT